MWRIRNWVENFETHETKKLSEMKWLPLPVKLGGDGYTEILDHPDGAAHFGAWTAIMKLAAGCRPRGTLIRDTGEPHTVSTISRVTWIPAPTLEAAIPRLLKCRWLEEICENPPLLPGFAGYLGSTGQGTTGQDITNNDLMSPSELEVPSSSLVVEFVTAWNAVHGRCPKISKCRDMKGARGRALVLRYKDADWKAHWREALEMVTDSPFLKGDNDRGWTATVEWFLRPGTVTKILEGQYSGRRPKSAMEVARSIESQTGGR